MINVRAHTCYLGKSGYSAHARSFFRELSKHVNLKIRNFTWDSNPTYLDDLDLSLLDTITLSDNSGKLSDFPIQQSFPSLKFKKQSVFIPDIEIVLMEENHYYFYDNYSAKTKIAYTVWESTELSTDFFNKILEFDYLWVATKWHRDNVIKQGYPIHKVFVVNEGVDSDFCNDEIVPLINEFDDKRFKFMFFGRWDYRKSVPEIVNAFLKSFSDDEPVDLILCADNPYSVDGMNSTEERLKRYGYDDARIKVKHFLNRSEYVSYIKNGNVLVSCARSEGWNIPLIESMAAGTPSIYSNWGGQLEFASNLGNSVKISKILPARVGANLGFAGNVPGNYCEPDFEDLTSVMRHCYENYNEVKRKAFVDRTLIRSEFSWKSAAEHAFNILKMIHPHEYLSVTRNESVTIVAHADTPIKSSILQMCVNSLKTQGYIVIVSSHVPVSDSVLSIADFVVIDKDNAVIYEDEFSKLSSTVPVHYINYQEFRVNYSFDYNHGYAALKLMKNGIGISHANNIPISHFVNYDYILTDPDVLIKNSKLLTDSDFSGFLWDSNSVSTAILSSHTDKYIKCLNLINSKKEYFKYDGIVMFEDVMKKLLEESNMSTNLRLFDDISKNNVLDAITLPTYPKIPSKTDKQSFLYLAKDENDEIFISAIGNDDESLNFTIEYENALHPFVAHSFPMIFIRIPKEMIINGFSVNLVDHNIKYDYSLKTKLASCVILNKSYIREISTFKPIAPIEISMSSKLITFNVNYVDGPFFEIKSDVSNGKKYTVMFIDSKNDETVYQTSMGVNCWARCNRKYYTRWRIKAIDESNNDVVYDEIINLNKKNVYFAIDSKSLGDTIAWFAPIEEFAKIHQCYVIVSTFNNNLFQQNYTNMQFVSPGTRVNNIHAFYKIGWFYNEHGTFDSLYHPRDFKSLPMQSSATDILGLQESLVNPRIVMSDKKSPIDCPYVCIAIHSTAQAKYWNNEHGWQVITDYFLKLKYKVVMLSLEENGYMGNKYPKGVTFINEKRTIENTITYLKHAKMFVGIGSGLSWLSWAIGIPTVIISGFSLPHTEPLDSNVIRIFNEKVCNGCFNRHKLDPGDWNWCPDKKGTSQIFECTKSISGSYVIEKIEESKLL